MHLTPRQHQILKLLRDGRTYRQVAGTLGVTAGTISGHLLQVARANGFSNVAAVRLATKSMALDITPNRKRKVFGVYPTKSGTYSAELPLGNKRKRWLGTYRTRPLAIAARLAAERAYRANAR